jgi:hypothetical protein
MLHGLAHAFDGDLPELQKSQVTRIGFACSTVEIAPDSRFELLLEVEPEYSSATGLGWAMFFSGWAASEDKCEAIFEVKLSRALSQQLALSRRPLCLACLAKPALLNKSFLVLPGLASALSSRVDAKALDKETPMQKSKPKTRML